MPYRRHASTLARTAALAGLLACAAPVLAQPSPPPPPPGTMDAAGRVYGDVTTIPAPPPPMAAPYGQSVNAQPRYDSAAWERAREDWLAECRHNNRSRRGNTLGGALVGGVVGGLLGNAVAGRGDKTVGTVVGAVAGAAAGGALGNGADRRQDRRAMDYCESYLERHMGYGYAPQGYAYGYQPMTVMVPVMMVQPQPVATPAAPPRECKETQVIEEWVPVAGPARRYIPRRPAPVKRVPDKRVRVY